LPDEHSAKRVERLLTKHARRASVVVEDGGKWSGVIRFVDDTVQRARSGGNVRRPKRNASCEPDHGGQFVLLCACRHPRGSP